jgi:hypothetical protein
LLFSAKLNNPAHVKTLAQAGRDFEPLSLPEQRSLVEQFRPYAARFAYYRGVI